MVFITDYPLIMLFTSKVNYRLPVTKVLLLVVYMLTLKKSLILLNKAIRYSDVDHYADNTNLQLSEKSIIDTSIMT